MPEGRKNGHDTFYVDPDFAAKMGMEPSEKKFDLPSLGDDELGYGSEMQTAKDKIPGQAAGEISSGNKGGEKTVMSGRVELGGEQTRISERPTDKTQAINLASLGEDGQSDETAIVGPLKRKS